MLYYLYYMKVTLYAIHVLDMVYSVTFVDSDIYTLNQQSKCIINPKLGM